MITSKTAVARRGACAALLLLTTLCAARPAAATDVVFFTAITDVRRVLIERIRVEPVRIDMAAWYLSEHEISLALVEAVNRGVEVRLIGDRVAVFESDPMTRREFFWLASQGVPIRLRYEPTGQPEPVHWKATIFAGQNLVTFGSANYTPFELAPISSTNYKDEIVMFSDDPTLAHAFKTRFDRMWNDTTLEPGSIVSQPPYLKNWNDACVLEPACADYRVQYPAPRAMIVNTARREPDYPMPPDLIWSQGPEFNQRLIAEIDRETVRIDLVTYRLTESTVADALIAKFRQGVPVRVIIEPEQYMSRTWPEYWLTHANIDRLWLAGIPIRQRAHAGLTHMKMLVTSAYATNASSNIASNWQRDHNLFVSSATRPAAYATMRQRFDVMWNDSVGFAPFTPLPADTPVRHSPASELTPLGLGEPIAWRAAPFATSYDVYLGTSPTSLAWVGSVPAVLTMTPPAIYEWTPRGLHSRTRYYWRVVSRTLAGLASASEPWPLMTALWQRAGDFTGDGQADFTVFRPDTGRWWTRSASGSGATAPVAWGTAGDIPAPADYDGDGRFDAAVFRPSLGGWFLRYSASGQQNYIPWGTSGDRPVPGDYDGDTLADVAVYRAPQGSWYVRESSTGRGWHLFWGANGDIPVPADYDGDGRTDVAVFRPASGEWFIISSRTGSPSRHQWGVAGDVPAVADYDGDGRADLVVFRPANNTWYLWMSTAGFDAIPWGLRGDIPVPGDFDGDGRSELALFRPSEGVWYVRAWAAGTTTALAWGTTGDVPVLQKP